MLITFALMFGLAAIAKPLIVILIGEKWLMAVPFLQIICFSEMLYPLHAINLNILQVRGYSGLFLKLEIVKKNNCCYPNYDRNILGYQLYVMGCCLHFISILYFK